jgi:hypothetical protein
VWKVGTRRYKVERWSESLELGASNDFKSEITREDFERSRVDGSRVREFERSSSTVVYTDGEVGNKIKRVEIEWLSP